MPALIRVEELSAGYGGRLLLERVVRGAARGSVRGVGNVGVREDDAVAEPDRAGAAGIGSGVGGDRDLVGAEGEERRALLRRFGVMFQNGALFGSLSLLENVRLPLEEFTRLDGEAMDLVARLKLHAVGLRGGGGSVAGGVEWGHAEAGGDCAGAGVGSGDRVFGRAFGGAGSGDLGGVGKLGSILDLSGALGVTFVVVTHELQSIFAIGQRAIMLDREVRGYWRRGHPRSCATIRRTTRFDEFFRREAED